MASVSSTNNDGSLTRYYTKVLGEAEKEKQAEIKRIRERADRELKHVQEGYTAANEKNVQDAETAINYVREDAQQAISDERDHSRESLDRAKEQLYNQKGQYETDRNLERRVVNKFIDDNLKRNEMNEKSLALRDADLVNKLETMSHSNDDKLRSFKDEQGQILETNNLNNRKMIEEVQKEADRKSTDAALHEVEHDNLSRREIRQMNDSYQAQMDRMAKNQKDRDSLHSNVLSDALAEKDNHYRELFKDQNVEHSQNLNNLEKSFEKHTTDTERKARSEEQRRDQFLANRLGESSKDKERALEQQTKNYQKAMTDQRKADQEAISKLETSVQRSKTSADINHVSPAAEENLRKIFTKNFDKTFSAEQEKNQRLNNDLYEKKVSDLNDMREDYQSQIAKNSRDFVYTQSQERANYIGNIMDTEAETNSKLQEKDSQVNRQTELLSRHYGRLLEKQKREFDNAYDTSRILAQNRMNEMRMDSELALKTAHKEYITKTNTLIKDYEKKLQDQKENYEFKLDDLKSQTAMELRTNDAKNKSDLELQSKAYETKIAQNAAQTKERERIIAQNYQEELDRTRRTYELAIQKKS